MSIKFSFIVLATVLLVLVCVEARSMGSKTRSALAKFKLRQALMHSGKRSANLHNTLQDDDVVNSCILTCVKCSNGEIDDESTDGENSVSLVCSNECLANTHASDFLDSLLSNSLFDKSFVKCVLEDIAYVSRA